ncbi:MAG: 3-hydroxyacyl-ACP dehydratase FabZ [Oligoflexales bacterium]|nr:3-hydroxyacyl-ACP dehydratase FabZ [Oligoflexales bacterium]
MQVAIVKVDPPLSASEIEKYLPHRYPFLLIDRILDYKPGVFIHALKNVSASDPIMQGHFPGNPIFPGVLLVEAMAQASAILGKFTRDKECSTCLLMEIENTRFRKSVVPGDTIHIHVKLSSMRKSFLWFEGECRVSDKVAVTANFSAKLE